MSWSWARWLPATPQRLACSFFLSLWILVIRHSSEGCVGVRLCLCTPPLTPLLHLSELPCLPAGRARARAALGDLCSFSIRYMDLTLSLSPSFLRPSVLHLRRLELSSNQRTCLSRRTKCPHASINLPSEPINQTIGCDGGMCVVCDAMGSLKDNAARMLRSEVA
jgi:hypothetical protein